MKGAIHLRKPDRMHAVELYTEAQYKKEKVLAAKSAAHPRFFLLSPLIYNISSKQWS